MEGERKKSMYRKDSEGWLKHADFIVLDMICLQLAYILAYAISGYGFNPYEIIIYRNMAVFLELADLVMIFAYGTMKSVLKRGYYRDFVVTLNHAIMVGVLAVLYLFLLQEGQDFSRLTLMLTIIIYLVMTYIVRELWKKLLRKEMKDGGERKLLIVTSEDVAEQVVLSMQENNYARFSLAGVAVIDADWTGIIAVIWNRNTLLCKISASWIGFSVLLLCVLGWGTSSNALFLYALYFSWAFWTPLFLSFQKIYNKGYKKSVIVILTCLFILMAKCNVAEFIRMLNFAVENYPL